MLAAGTWVGSFQASWVQYVPTYASSSTAVYAIGAIDLVCWGADGSYPGGQDRFLRALLPSVSDAKADL